MPKGSSTTSTGLLPAWLPDPFSENEWRYFNGSDWTEEVRKPGHLPSARLWLRTSWQALTARPTTSIILGVIAGGIPAVLLGQLIVLRFARTKADTAPIVQASGRGLFDLVAIFVVMVLIWAMGSLGLVYFLHGAQRGRWNDAGTCLKEGRSRTFSFFARWLIVSAVVAFAFGLVALVVTQIARGVAIALGGADGLSPALDWFLTIALIVVPLAIFTVAVSCVVAAVPVAAMIAPKGISPIRAAWHLTAVPMRELAPRITLVLAVTAAGLGVGYFALRKISFPAEIPESLLNGPWPLWMAIGVVATSLAALIATSLLVRLYLDAGGAEGSVSH